MSVTEISGTFVLYYRKNLIKIFLSQKVPFRFNLMWHCIVVSLFVSFEFESFLFTSCLCLDDMLTLSLYLSVCIFFVNVSRCFLSYPQYFSVTQTFLELVLRNFLCFNDKQ